MHGSTAVSQAEERLVEERRHGLGGTDAAAVLGVHPWRSALQVWAEKTGRLEPPDISDNPRVRAGKFLEPAVADWYAAETGHRIQEVPMQHRPDILDSRGRPFLIAHLDREIIGGDRVDRDGPGILEIKTADWRMADEWEDGPPLGYQVQWQHYSLVTGYRWGAIAVLLGGNDFRIYDMTRDDEFVATLQEQLTAWWERHVVGDVQPEPGPIDADVLARLYPRDSGEEVALPEEALAWDEALRQIKQEMKGLELRRRTLENKLKAAIGSASVGRLPGGQGAYTFRTVQRKSYTVEATEYRVLRRTR